MRERPIQQASVEWDSSVHLEEQVVRGYLGQTVLSRDTQPIAQDRAKFLGASWSAPHSSCTYKVCSSPSPSPSQISDPLREISNF